MINVLDKPGALIGLLIGLILIVFRKRIRSLYLKKHFEEHITPKKVEYQHEMQKMKLEGIFHKGLEIVSLAVGMLLLLMSAAKFFPQTSKHIGYFIAYCLIAFFAACAAGLVELIFIAPYLMRNVRKYTQERYGNGYQTTPGFFRDKKLNATGNELMNDLVLKSLQKKALVHLIASFSALFAIFLLTFCIIFRLTS